MKTELQKISIQDVVRYSMHLEKCQGYSDKGEEGVYGMDGRLNIRPSYQREFIYKDTQRNAVINTVRNSWTLGLLHWVKNRDGSYEVLDGQQRLISIGQYVSGDFSIKDLYFHNLTADQQRQILDYKLLVYFCEGSDSEKLDWFRTINIAGEKLYDQELRNAVYAGPWVSDAKRFFTRNGCPAYRIADKYLRGKMNRQDYLETAVKWVSNGNIEGYMAKYQHDKNAKDLWRYFSSVIDWVKKVFPTYRREMKGVPFGLLYNEYRNNEYNPEEVKVEVDRLMADEDVTKRSGIYTYIFTRNEKELNIRTFTDGEKRMAYEMQERICAHCDESFDINEMEADHIEPWSKGGKTVLENCQMLCLQCNRTKGPK